MNFTPTQKAWMLLICLVISSGGAVFLTAYLGGSKMWLALVSGLITSASSVYHALSKSPTDNNNNQTP